MNIRNLASFAILLASAATAPATTLNFDDIQIPAGALYNIKADYYAASQGVSIYTVASGTDGKSLYDVVIPSIHHNPSPFVDGFELINYAPNSTSAPNFIAPLTVDASGHAYFESDDLFITLPDVYTFAQVATDRAVNDAPDVVRLLALKSFGPNLYQIVGIATGLDNATTSPENLLTLNVAGGFDALVFETTTEQEGIDNLTFATPEPSSWALLMSGAGLVFAGYRRRRKQ